jgi:two-component system OmpR family sensor kinase
VLAYLLIIVVAFLIVAMTMISMVGEYLFSQKVRQEQHIAEELSQYVESALYQKEAEQLFTRVMEASAQNGGRVIVADANGVVQADARSEYNGQRLALSEVAAVLTYGTADYGFYSLSSLFNQTGAAVLRSALKGEDVLGVYTVPILSSVAGQIGVLVYIADSTDVYDSLSTIQNQMLMWLVLVATSVLLMSIFVTRMVTKPLAEFNRGIAGMARGDLSTRVYIRGKGEFAQLSEAFNSMSERLEALDNSRNQFVSNASHELKTPLSTMKVLSETLIYQEPPDPGMTKEFLTDINREIDRLNATVDDLLTLVHFDSNKIELRTVRARLDQIVASTIHRLQPLAQNKGIALKYVEAAEIECLCDDRKLEQVFYNLVDNALKYTPEGGEVRVSVSREGHSAVIRVADNGIGIPKADQMHIFDRFYRVDKARARVTGGTGLGLSIVKQIMRLHGGTVTLDSEENKGSVFTVDLPIVNI